MPSDPISGPVPSTTADDGPPEAIHAWDRLLPAWHWLVAALGLVTGVLIATDRTEPVGSRQAALGCLGLLAAWYALAGGRLLGPGRSPRQVTVAVAVTSALAVLLFALAPVGAVLLFALYPQLWMSLPTRRAVVATVGIGTCVTAVAVLRSEGDRAAQLGWVVSGALGAVCAILLGMWITIVVAQSRRRAGALEELTRLRHELDHLSRQAGAATERDRWVAEVHDTLAQGFAGITLLLEAAQARLPEDDVDTRRLLASAHRTAQENLSEARALVAGLTPPALRETALAEALGQLIDRAGSTGPEQVDLALRGTPRPLPPDLEVTVLRIAQEAITNATRHARARRVHVELCYRPDSLALEVRDDGCGFAPGPAHTGVGLTTMRMRAAHVGGRLTLDSGATGTAVLVELPVSRP